MYQRATTQKCVISTKLFYRAMVTRVTNNYSNKALIDFFARFEKKDLTMVEIKTCVRKAWHVK